MPNISEQVFQEGEGGGGLSKHVKYRTNKYIFMH